MITSRINFMPLCLLEAPFTGVWQELCPAIPAPLVELKFVNDSDTGIWISFDHGSDHAAMRFVQAGGTDEIYIEQFTPADVQAGIPAGLSVYILCSDGALGTKGRIAMMSCSFYRR